MSNETTIATGGADAAPAPPVAPPVPAHERRFHFVSGLPRSGSTLLGAILRQNPAFQAGMSSPVASLFENVVAQVSAGSELGRMMDEDARERVLRGLFGSFYRDEPAPVVFDTNRAWCARLPELARLFPQSKVICCVRDLAWVMDSLERQYRGNAFENTGLFNNPAERSTVYTRTEALAAPGRLVGFAYQALREACWGEGAERLALIDYDVLVARPAEVIDLIYDFVGEARFAHDFEAIEYDVPGFDAGLGMDGLHRVRPRVEAKPRRTILPPDLFAKYSGQAFWRDLTDCAAHRIVQGPTRGATREAVGDGPAKGEVGAVDAAIGAGMQ